MTVPAADDRLEALRQRIREHRLSAEPAAVASLLRCLGWSHTEGEAVAARGAALVRDLRQSESPELMESFLAEYGLSTREGVALMCLAEALLRVPDAETIDALIADKIAPSDWGRHLGRASSSLVNASTWALMLTGQILGEEDDGLVGLLHGVVRRLGEPVVRTAVSQAMREMGHQFVLGRDIGEAIKRARDAHAKGYTYSYDMLGEAARTSADARRYHLAYSNAIASLSSECVHASIRDNPGISVKLSALHERYEYAQRQRMMSELVARTRSLAMLAHSANMGFNIDAEEADRLDLSLDVIEAVLREPSLAGWDGFGVVVQTYGPRAPHVLDWLHALAERLDRRIMVRLVKGAYWDTEIKHAQVEGFDGFPVFTRKVSTDISFMACAGQVMGMTDRIYPQFATHNAHTVAAVLRLAADHDVVRDRFEFQRLHGMGEGLHELVRAEEGTRCRIYAPVGAHRDLLAYLVRRLLENGANSSFVHQIVDARIAPEQVAADPLGEMAALGDAIANPVVVVPAAIHGPQRRGARGYDLTDPTTVMALDSARAGFRTAQWSASPSTMSAPEPQRPVPVVNPASAHDVVGQVVAASAGEVDRALEIARAGAPRWNAAGAEHRAQCLERIAERYESNAPELFALLAREAGKTLPDAVAELREAVDFCRFYASEARRLAGGGALDGRGTFVCISPWNFPLAIFTGQIVAALVSGNAVIAKPAEQTPLIAARAVALMHEAGIATEALQLLPGDGPSVGGALVGDARVAGVCFTGSTATALHIHRAMAAALDPDAPLIAETGGLNAMVVDSTALPEQAVRDIIVSSFQSAGQRCSALRVLYLQADVETRFVDMLTGAMDSLAIGDPWLRSTDVGPVIDDEAHARIEAHCRRMDDAGRRIKRVALADELSEGRYVAPSVYRLDGMHQMAEEVFGPVLHVVRFEVGELDKVTREINDAGYGLTFGLHTRVDSRVQEVVDRVRCGNLYVNRNQIGAVVGVQPFGGEGLSGTGPKAGGPFYLRRFMAHSGGQAVEPAPSLQPLPPAALQQALERARSGLATWREAQPWPGRLAPLLDALDAPMHELARQAIEAAATLGPAVMDLPGPTGESNRLSLHPRGVVLCLGGDDPARALAAAMQSLALGDAAVVCAGPVPGALAGAVARTGVPLVVLEGTVQASALATLEPLDAVAASFAPEPQRAIRMGMASRDGAIVPLVPGLDTPERFVLERVLSVDTTAAGGNAALLAEATQVPVTE